jgi:hypothetical protein
VDLELVETRTFSSRVVYLRYRVARSPTLRICQSATLQNFIVATSEFRRGAAGGPSTTTWWPWEGLAG